MIHIPLFDQLFSHSNEDQIERGHCEKISKSPEDVVKDKVCSTESIRWANRGYKRKAPPVRVPKDGKM